MREAPAKAALHREFQADGLEVIGVSLQEDHATVRAFAEKLDIPFLLLRDETGRSPGLFGLWGHPNTVLVDRQGRVVGLVRGERDWQSPAALAVVRHLLDGRPPAGARGSRSPSQKPAPRPRTRSRGFYRENKLEPPSWFAAQATRRASLLP